MFSTVSPQKTCSSHGAMISNLSHLINGYKPVEFIIYPKDQNVPRN